MFHSSKILVAVILLHGLLSTAQNASGVYVGSLITSKNALIISVKGSYFNGDIFISSTEKLNITGVYNPDSIKGIFTYKGQTIMAKGWLRKDSLKLSLYSEDGLSIDNHRLHKISKNTNYDVSKLFSDGKSEKDLRLIGTWYPIKIINNKGIEVEKARKNFEISFFNNGSYTHVEPEMEAMMTSLKLNYRWATQSGNLIITRMATPPFNEEHEHITPYSIRGDTLIRKDEFRTEFFLRKENRK